MSNCILVKESAESSICFSVFTSCCQAKCIGNEEKTVRNKNPIYPVSQINLLSLTCAMERFSSLSTQSIA